jgi:transcriptional regulator with XRE-family HTH domain
VVTLRKKFGWRLREIRAQRGITQERFAEVLNISVDFLSLMERGISAPSFETLERIGKCLRMPVAELFTFELASTHTTRQRMQE